MLASLIDFGIGFDIPSLFGKKFYEMGDYEFDIIYLFMGFDVVNFFGRGDTDDFYGISFTYFLLLTNDWLLSDDYYD